MTKYRRYRDYVIKDSKFVGDRVDFQDWGSFRRKEYNGGKRTFLKGL